MGSIRTGANLEQAQGGRSQFPELSLPGPYKDEATRHLFA